MERFSISMSSEMKRQLEQMAKVNFRNLNGEINKALDDYIRKNGASVDIEEPIERPFEPHILPTEPVRHQLTPPMHQNEPTITTLHHNDEVEEF